MGHAGRSAPRRALAAALLLALLGAGCSAPYGRKLEVFRTRYAQADFAGADAALDEVLAKESRTDPEELARTNGLAADADRGDTYLLLLEKAMTQLALGRAKTALELLRTARDVLETRQARTAREYFAAALRDDRALAYQGADYEHILVRVMLCLTDLLVHSSQTGGDAYAFALQIGEKQEELIESPLGQDFGYRPRQEYRRVGIGAYLQGVILEATGAPDGAARAYRRCLDYEPDFALGREALQRAEAGVYAPPGEGVLHVFHLAGPGPFHAEGTSPPTDLAMRIAQWIAAVLLDSPVPLVQTDIPVPVLVVRTSFFPALHVAAAGRSANTEALLDVNRVAGQQLEAMRPLVLARAIVRRSIKTATTTVAAEVGKRKNRGGTGAAIEIGAALANLLWTAAERADTRLWSSLPAQIQVARITLPEGVHDVRFDGMTERVRITAGRDTYAVVVRPAADRPGTIVIDRLSRAPAGGPQEGETQ